MTMRGGSRGLFNQDQTTKPCKRCGTGNILTGPNSKYNAVSKIDNTQICPDCGLAETILLFKQSRTNAT